MAAAILVVLSALVVTPQFMSTHASHAPVQPTLSISSETLTHCAVACLSGWLVFTAFRRVIRHSHGSIRQGELPNTQLRFISLISQVVYNKPQLLILRN